MAVDVALSPVPQSTHQSIARLSAFSDSNVVFGLRCQLPNETVLAGVNDEQIQMLQVGSATALARDSVKLDPQTIFESGQWLSDKFGSDFERQREEPST